VTGEAEADESARRLNVCRFRRPRAQDRPRNAACFQLHGNLLGVPPLLSQGEIHFNITKGGGGRGESCAADNFFGSMASGRNSTAHSRTGLGAAELSRHRRGGDPQAVADFGLLPGGSTNLANTARSRGDYRRLRYGGTARSRRNAGDVHPKRQRPPVGAGSAWSSAWALPRWSCRIQAPDPVFGIR